MGKSVIKKFLKKFDYFGVQFNFHYKSKEKFHSATGGLIFLLFVVVTITYIGLNISSFINRENFSIIYYTMRTSQTDEISFEKYKSNFAFGISCGSISNQSEINSMFDANLNHISKVIENGSSTKLKTKMNLTNCGYQDFYNEFNESFDEIGLNTYMCPDLNSTNGTTLKGIYSDNIFNYFELTIQANKDSDKEAIKKLLVNDECDLNIYFIDVAVDLYNYTSPIERFINTNFVVLKLSEYVKMNLDFMIQKFDSFENYLFDNHHSKYYIGFNSLEQYSLFKGDDRFETKVDYYDTFAKIYFRASLNRNMIQRKYMKLTEFAANMSSILSQALLFLFVTVSFINRTYANHSVMKKIFQFKEVRGDNEKSLKTPQRITFTHTHAASGMTLSQNSNVGTTNSDVNPMHLSGKSIFMPKTPTSKNNLNQATTEKNFGANNRIRTYGQFYNGGTGPTSEDSPVSPTQLAKKFKGEKIKNNNITLKYSLCELVVVFIFPCCAWSKLKLKNALMAKAKKKFFFQLDILTYLKNMQLIELLNYISLENNEKVIMHFLAKPSISLMNKIDIYDRVNEKYNVDVDTKELTEFYKAMKILSTKTNKTPLEQRLYYISSIEMNNLLNDK